LSAIVDGNVTNLIVCVVLYYTGTPEIKGFAITMGVGVVATLFAALVVSRFVFEVMVALGWRKGSMLPMAIPQLQQWLTPNIDWMKYRFVFFGISACVVALGLGMAFYQGKKMLDIEFVGGTQITLAFKNDPSWKPDPNDPGAVPPRVMLDRSEVEKRVQNLGEGLPPGDLLAKFASAEVYPVDPQPNGVTSDQFIVRTTAQSQDSGAILRPVIEAFSDVLATRPKLDFSGSDEAMARSAPVFPIDKPVLGANINRAGLSQDVSAYLGGTAIVLEDIEPAPTLDGLRSRLETSRQTVEFSDTLARKREVMILDGDESAVKSAVLLVVDEDASLLENEQAWEALVRDREWKLVGEALTKESTPASVHSFSPAIAETFRANATVAAILSFLLIGAYIWVRFKTPRYSIAAVVALIHDVLAVLGLVALAEILSTNPSTQSFAQSIKLLPFKIDLNLVAALLTIAGYSLNDTVVIMDRIRENRGKLPYATRDIINASINQTFSRTLITGGTTLFSCLVLYLIGGEGMRAFAFALMTGLIVGTYSSVGVAAPIVWSRAGEEEVHAEAARA
jgi:SecD/SecF fusion protein